MPRVKGCPVQEGGGGGGISWKEGVEALNCLKHIGTGIHWPQREKNLIVYASEA